jgi:hypothetical protein
MSVNIAIKGLIVLICFSLFCGIHAKLIVSLPNNETKIYRTAQIYFQGFDNPFDPIEAPLVLPNGTLPGAIVLVPIGSPPEIVTRQYQARGVVGLVMFSTSEVPGFLAFNQDNQDTSDITIPASDMAPSKYRELVGILGPLGAAGIQVTAVLDSEDGNAWKDVFSNPGTYVAQILIGILCIANIILASINLRNVILYRDRGAKFSVPQIILGVQILANLVRLAQMVDPNGMRAVYSYAANRVLATFTYPMILSSALLITLFWHECLVKVSIDINPFLSKMKIPFFVISAVMCIFEFLNSALRSRNIARNELLLSLQIFYAIIAGLILLFYIVTSIRIIQRLKSRKNLGVKARSVSKRTAVIFIFMGICLAIWVSQMSAASVLVQTAAGYAANILVLHTTMHLVSMALIFIFSVNSTEKEASRSKASGSSRNKTASRGDTSMNSKDTTELSPRV